jgi:hypothetical protein
VPRGALRGRAGAVHLATAEASRGGATRGGTRAERYFRTGAA